MEVVSGWEELLSCSHGDPHGSRCLRERERERGHQPWRPELERFGGGQSRLDRERRREYGFGRMTERERGWTGERLTGLILIPFY